MEVKINFPHFNSLILDTICSSNLFMSFTHSRHDSQSFDVAILTLPRAVSRADESWDISNIFSRSS